MEDLQLWVYIAFGIIYVISRALRKKQPEPPRESPLETEQSSRPQRRKQPASFEELLREITEARNPQVELEEDASSEEVVEPKTETARNQNKQDFSLEGEKRYFSDDQSREIYERSIAAAADSDAGLAEVNIPKLKARQTESKQASTTSHDIKSMLANPDSAKKAIILSEILHRKY